MGRTSYERRFGQHLKNQFFHLVHWLSVVSIWKESLTWVVARTRVEFGRVTFGESQGSLPQPQDSFPDASEAINDFWSMSGNFIYRHHVEPRVKIYSRREKNHSLPHWSTLTFPELHIRIWMWSKKSALMIIGILIVLETCLILGQGSHNLLYSTKKLLTDKKNRGGLTRKQFTSRPDHIWPELWKTMGKHAKLENARKLRGIYFVDLEDREFKKTSRTRVRSWKHQWLLLCRLKLWKLWEWWIQQNENKTCMYSGSWWICENAFGKLDTAK